MILFVRVLFNKVKSIYEWIYLSETWILVICKLGKMSSLSLLA